jgi:hypothetical protein
MNTWTLTISLMLSLVIQSETLAAEPLQVDLASKSAAEKLDLRLPQNLLAQKRGSTGMRGWTRNKPPTPTGDDQFLLNEIKFPITRNGDTK